MIRASNSTEDDDERNDEQTQYGGTEDSGLVGAEGDEADEDGDDEDGDDEG